MQTDFSAKSEISSKFGDATFKTMLASLSNSIDDLIILAPDFLNKSSEMNDLSPALAWIKTS